MFRLRELVREDVPIINVWRSNRELTEYLGAPFRYINKEVDYKWFDNYMSNRATDIRCSITNEKDRVIGLVSLTNINRINQSAVFHIMIGDNSNRGGGAGFYATNEMLKHAFSDINLNRIELSVLDSNKRAIKLYEKSGFKQEGIKRKSVYKNGDFVDLVMMAVLKEEFFSKNS